VVVQLVGSPRNEYMRAERASGNGERVCVRENVGLCVCVRLFNGVCESVCDCVDWVCLCLYL